MPTIPPADTVTVTWSDGTTTTYTGVAGFAETTNGVKFSGREADDTTDSWFFISAANYRSVKHTAGV